MRGQTSPSQRTISRFDDRKNPEILDPRAFVQLFSMASVMHKIAPLGARVIRRAIIKRDVGEKQKTKLALERKTKTHNFRVYARV